MPIVQLESTKDFNDFISQKKLTLVNFYGEWSEECRYFASDFDVLARDFGGMVQFGIVNAGQSRETHMISAEYEIETFPTFIFYKKGLILDKIEGSDIRKLVIAIQEYGQ